MPKSRIYEIAQELNKTNKEVIEFLKEKKVEVKSHMSTLEEKDEKMVRDAFTGKNEGKEEKKEAADRPKKKSNLIQYSVRRTHRPRKVRISEETNRSLTETDRTDRQEETVKETAVDIRTVTIRTETVRREDSTVREEETIRTVTARAEMVRREDSTAREEETIRIVMARAEITRVAVALIIETARIITVIRDRTTVRTAETEAVASMETETDKTETIRTETIRVAVVFDNNRNGMNRDNRDRDGRENNGRRNERRDSRPAMDSMDLGLARKPVRDVKNKEKDKEKEREREEKKTQTEETDRDPTVRTRDVFQKSRLPKALQKPARPQPKEEKKEVVKEITLPEKMTIRELAEKMKMQPAVIVKKLFMEGTMVTVNHEIDFEKAQEIALDYDIIAEQEEKVDVIEELLKEEEEDPKDLVPRPPVVCVMGHVDHGKTSLLDAIRKTNVTDREAGGITQHIGAYVVSIKGQKITFLDTPGHEAFTAMRMRGANSTDIAVLVVAADDGVMPQTVEAINHAKAAGVEIIVAINKVDKPSANIERVKQELSEYELIPEDWGGSTIFVPVSAKTHQGIEELLEMILLTSEVCELKANPKRKARGLVIEAQLDKGKGPVATILVQKGTLHVGDFIAAGASSGKVRAMMDDKGRRVKEAGPSTPVEILGLSDVPNAGEVLVATENDKEAKNFAATFISENKNRLLEETKAKMSLDDLFSQIQEGNLKELNLIVKADVQGSVEAVKQSLVKLSNDEVVVKVIHGGVGAINESDVTLASASNAIIIGFNVRPDATAKATAEQEGVDLRLYRVIYQAIEDVEAAMKGMLDPVFEEKVIGHAEVRQIFKASGVGNIAGSYVLDGVFQRGCTVRISREGKQIFEGPMASLKRFKDDVKEVKAGYECGLVFEGFNDIQELDQVEAYIMVEVPR